jgi:hypothetical protein
MSFAAGSVPPFTRPKPSSSSAESTAPVKPDYTLSDPLGSVQPQPKTPASDFCCPQSFKERSPTITCVLSVLRGSRHRRAACSTTRNPLQSRVLPRACAVLSTCACERPPTTSDVSSPNLLLTPVFAVHSLAKERSRPHVRSTSWTVARYRRSETPFTDRDSSVCPSLSETPSFATGSRSSTSFRGQPCSELRLS